MYTSILLADQLSSSPMVWIAGAAVLLLLLADLATSPRAPSEDHDPAHAKNPLSRAEPPMGRTGRRH